MSETRAPYNTITGNQSFFELFVDTAARETKLFTTTRSDEVVSEIAGYIELQITLLPKILRFAVKLAIRTFILESIIFHGKTFNAASPSSRLGHMKRWENSRIAARRDFIRYFRSLVLFNYYDHPDIRSRI